jgi:hypothetical protein
MRTGMNAPAVLIDKYINSAYDTVKTVADAMDDVTLVANSIDELDVINTYPQGTLTHYHITLASATDNVSLVGVGDFDSMIVFIDGVQQIRDGYTFLEGTLTFSEVLPIGTEIVIYSSNTLI